MFFVLVSDRLIFTIPFQPSCHLPPFHHPHDHSADDKRRAGHTHDAQEIGHRSELCKAVIRDMYEDEVTQVDSESERRQIRQPSRRFQIQFSNDDKYSVGHHKDIDSGKVPDDLQISIISGILFLEPDISQSRNQITHDKHRHSDAERFSPAPCGGYSTK